MGTIGEISTLLDKIPLWKRLTSLPKEVEELRTRVAELELLMRGGSGQLCPMCASAQFTRERTDDSLSAIGYITDHFRCRDCGHQEPRQRDVLQR